MTKISALSIRLRTHELLLHAPSVALMGVVAGHAYAQKCFRAEPLSGVSSPVNYGEGSRSREEGPAHNADRWASSTGRTARGR